MSLLWPERIVVGLFPGFCWFRRGKAISVLEVAADAQPDDLLATFERFLHMPGQPARNARIEVLVTDHLAHMVTLPWQSGLAGRRLIHAYGVACLTSAGLTDVDDWVVEAGFRHPGAFGLAYALRKEWLAQIVSSAESSRAVVSTVIPASTAAYWYHEAHGQHALSLLVMIESARISTLIFQRGQLACMDVEPIIGSMQSSLGRLAARVRVTRGNAGHLSFWAAANDIDSPMMEGIFSGIKCVPIMHRHWSAHG